MLYKKNKKKDKRSNVLSFYEIIHSYSKLLKFKFLFPQNY